MPVPVHIAAIDAGSNAVRLSVVRAFSALDIEPLHNERYPLRLGESVFVRNRFSEDVFKKAPKEFLKRSPQRSGIQLEVISAAEESRLGREAVFAALGPDCQARCIADLGGGSLEISILRDHKVLQSAQFPLGPVRLMTTLNLHGQIRPVQAVHVRRYLGSMRASD